MKRLNRLSIAGAAVLALGVFAAVAPAALAGHGPYSPGWNRPDPNVPKPLYDFIPGCWGESARHWPDQDSCKESASSRPIPYGTTNYGMVPGGDRYRQVQ